MRAAFGGPGCVSILSLILLATPLSGAVALPAPEVVDVRILPAVTGSGD